jgi:hypothetical protein
MKTLITDVIDLINSDATAINVNNMFIGHTVSYAITDLDTLIHMKKDIIKRFYFYKQEQDTIFDGLSFQADQASLLKHEL